MANTWMVRAGQGGRWFPEFRDREMVAVGWHEVRDVAQLTTREAVLAKAKIAYPNYKEQAVVVAAGQIFRFWREIKEGDRVVTYDPTARSYLCGAITGAAFFDASEEVPILTTKRKVRWERETPRDGLSPSTLNTLGAILTLFVLPPNVSDELWNGLSPNAAKQRAPIDEAGQLPPPQSLNDSDISSSATEAIKDRIAELDWDDLQELVAGLLRAMGYKTVVSPPGADRGKDIVASPDGFGFEEPKIIVEVKHRAGQRMGASDIRSFLGGRHPRDKGLYVSTGGFSKDAYYEADRAQIPLTLMDFERLVESILDYYPKFDEETRQILPLRKIYWPIGK